MMEIDFEWPVSAAGYEITETTKEKESRRGTTLLTGEDSRPGMRANGPEVKIIRPFDHHPVLFTEFAKLDGSKGQCIQFANHYGMLGLWTGLGRSTTNEGYKESLADWVDAIADMQEWVRRLENSEKVFLTEFKVTRLDVIARPVAGRLTMVYAPRSLIGAMHLQLVQQAISGRPVRTCEWCHTMFEPPRSDARFCSAQCRTNFHNHKRKAAAKP